MKFGKTQNVINMQIWLVIRNIETRGRIVIFQQHLKIIDSSKLKMQKSTKKSKDLAEISMFAVFILPKPVFFILRRKLKRRSL